MKLNMKKCVLVSGGAGFIGSHVTVELIESGYDVIVADNLSNSDLTCFEGVKKITGKEDIPFYKMDFCDEKATDDLFATNKIDAVIHFAGFKAVGESVAEPLKYYRNNLESFINVIESARRHGCRNILFSSSATVYGEPEKLPVTEESPRQSATSPYGNTKQMCEDILRDSVSAYSEIRGIALRYFNPVGAHPSALIGELPRGVPNNLVPFITQTAIGIRECLSVFGNDYPTPDGSCQRDFIDIVDLAKAHVCAVRRMIDDKMKKEYDLVVWGTGAIGMMVLNAVMWSAGITICPYGYLNPVIIGMTVFFFLFFTKWDIGSKPWINYVATIVFSVYLAHSHCFTRPLVVEFWRWINIQFGSLCSIPVAILSFAALFMICLPIDRFRIKVFDRIFKWKKNNGGLV